LLELYFPKRQVLRPLFVCDDDFRESFDKPRSSGLTAIRAGVDVRHGCACFLVSSANSSSVFGGYFKYPVKTIAGTMGGVSRTDQYRNLKSYKVEEKRFYRKPEDGQCLPNFQKTFFAKRYAYNFLLIF
jgi:hypothetical protein